MFPSLPPGGSVVNTYRACPLASLPNALPFVSVDQEGEAHSN